MVDSEHLSARSPPAAPLSGGGGQGTAVQGLGRGPLTKTPLSSENGVINNQLRFPMNSRGNKALDFIGDRFIFSAKPIRGNVVAVKSGHTLNIELLKKIFNRNVL